MKEVKLRNGLCLVDDEDYKKVIDWKYPWFIGKRGYACTSFAEVGKTHATRKHFNMYLHHFIFGKPPMNLVTDHINRNKLDNRKENLRFVTRQENGINRGKFNKLCTSKHKGVSWFKAGKNWRAYTVRNRKQINFGYFETEEEAKNAYEKGIQNL